MQSDCPGNNEQKDHFQVGNALAMIRQDYDDDDDSSEMDNQLSEMPTKQSAVAAVKPAPRSVALKLPHPLVKGDRTPVSQGSIAIDKNSFYHKSMQSSAATLRSRNAQGGNRASVTEPRRTRPTVRLNHNRHAPNHRTRKNLEHGILILLHSCIWLTFFN